MTCCVWSRNVWTSAKTCVWWSFCLLAVNEWISKLCMSCYFLYLRNKLLSELAIIGYVCHDISIAAFNAVPNLFCIYHQLQYSVLQIKICLFMGMDSLTAFTWLSFNRVQSLLEWHFFFFLKFVITGFYCTIYSYLALFTSSWFSISEF